jgi:hypothetical protein
MAGEAFEIGDLKDFKLLAMELTQGYVGYA